MNGKTLGEIMSEIRRSDAKWGKDNPDGTSAKLIPLAESFKALTQTKHDTKTVTWADILAEETAEAISETDLRKLRAELLQVAAVAIRWIRSLDERVDPQRYPYLEKLTALELSHVAKRCMADREAGREDSGLYDAVTREVECRVHGTRS